MQYLDSKPTNLTFHPLAELFPVLEGEEAKQLQDDIQVRGLHISGSNSRWSEPV